MTGSNLRYSVQGENCILVEVSCLKAKRLFNMNAA